MYPNLVPRQYAADGGLIQKFAFGGDAVGDSLKDVLKSVSPYTYSPEEQAAQKAARDAVAQQKALRKSQGSGQMYSNINAGLAALAPESFPGTPPALSPDRLRAIQEAYAGIAARPADQVSDAERYQVAQQNKFSPAEIAAAYPGIGFGEVNRIMGRGAIQQNYAPMLQGQRDALSKQKAILDNTGTTNRSPFANLARVVSGALRGSTLMPNPTDRYDFIPDPRLPEGMMGTMGGTGYDPVTGRMDLGTAGGSGQYVRPNQSNFMNMGGIAALGTGGYPRRTGQISGPGTEKSDSIPAMLSDGEFVMTAKAVRGAGKGNRRAGAKKMYALMNQLEKNAARG